MRTLKIKWIYIKHVGYECFTTSIGVGQVDNSADLRVYDT